MSGFGYAAQGLRHGLRRRQLGQAEGAGVARALWIAGLCLLALALIWVVAELVPQAQVRDSLALRDFVLLSGPRVSTVANFLLSLLGLAELRAAQPVAQTLSCIGESRHRLPQVMATTKGRVKPRPRGAVALRLGSFRQLTGNVQPASAISAWAVTHTGVCALVRE